MSKYLKILLFRIKLNNIPKYNPSFLKDSWVKTGIRYE